MSDTLVINADGQPVSMLPISTVVWKEAIMYMYHDKCDVLEWYDNWVVRSPSWETKVPAVIMLRDFLRRNTTPRFSKSNLYLRDMYHCQYCNTLVTNKTATLDHVLPVSRGGKTRWDNAVTACKDCNGRKGNRTDMKPFYKPYQPGYYELARKRKQLPIDLRHESWATWLGLNEDLHTA